MDMRVRNENQYVLKMFGMKAENIQRVKDQEHMWSFQLTDITGAKLAGQMHYYTGKDTQREPSALNVLSHYVSAQHSVEYNEDKKLTPEQKESVEHDRAEAKAFESAFPSKMNELAGNHAVGNNCLLDSDIEMLPKMLSYQKRIAEDFVKPQWIPREGDKDVALAMKETLYIQETYGLTFSASYQEQTDEVIHGHRYFSDRYECTFMDANGCTFETQFTLGEGYGTPSEEAIRPLQVLDSLVRDLASIDDYSNYEEFAAEFGYDADSRKGEQVYKNCISLKETFDRVFPGTLDKMSQDPSIQEGQLTPEADAKLDKLIDKAVAKEKGIGR